MTPAARAQAAIAILDRILAGEPAEAALLRWARGSRFAGSNDRAAVRDLVFDNLRRARSRAVRGGAQSGRGLMLGMCRELGIAPDTLFTGERHAPELLAPAELRRGAEPSDKDQLDLPEWLIPEWQQALGQNARPVALALRDRAAVWLRVNDLRATPQQAIAALAAEGIAVKPWPGLAGALQVTEGARRLNNTKAYAQGLVELQDLSPQLACAALPVASSVLDYCAGGGGKALALAARGVGQVTAHDIDARRMQDLPARAARAGARIRIAQPGQVRGHFDLVVADVPCSGSGTWRRTPDSKWRLTPGQLAQLGQAQSTILDRVAQHVTSKGHLAYMTCSVLGCENQRQIAEFLQRTPHFRLCDERLFTPLDASDGFYLALLQRD